MRLIPKTGLGEADGDAEDGVETKFIRPPWIIPFQRRVWQMNLGTLVLDVFQ